MKKSFMNLLILPAMLVILSLACQLSGGPTPPRVVTTSPQEAKTAESNIQKARPDPKTGKIELTITEAQLTSYITYNLQREYASILKDPVIVIEPGKLDLYGTILGDSFTANGRISLKITINPRGEPSVEILEANFGPIPVPAGLLSNLTKAVNQSLLDAVSQNNSGYVLENITLTTGEAKVILRKKE